MLLEDLQDKHIGYRIVTDQDGQLVSIAGNEKVDPTIGKVSVFGGAGLYLGTSKKFVMDYYSELTDYDDVLLTYEYNSDDLLSGNLEDSDGEVTVRKARLIEIERL